MLNIAIIVGLDVRKCFTSGTSKVRYSLAGRVSTARTREAETGRVCTSRWRGRAICRETITSFIGVVEIESKAEILQMFVISPFIARKRKLFQRNLCKKGYDEVFFLSS